MYKKGSNNSNADALSRIYVDESYTDNSENKLEPTNEEKRVIFKEMHDKPYGGHLRYE